MRYDFTLVGFTLSFGVLLLASAVFIFTRKEVLIGLKLIGTLSIFSAIYCLSYSGFLLRDSEMAMLTYSKISYFGISYISLFWFLIARQQKATTRKFSRRLFGWLLVLPILFNLTNLLYGLPLPPFFDFLTKAFFVSDTYLHVPSIGEGYYTIIFTKGVLYYVMFGFDMVLMIMSSVYYGRSIKNGGFVAKTNLIILLVLSILGALSLVLTLFSRQTAVIDLYPLLSGMITLAAFIALYKYELFDLTPLAYKKAFSNAVEPIFVLDRAYNVINYNVAAVTQYEGILDFTNRITIDDFKLPGGYSLKDEIIKTGETEYDCRCGIFYRVKLHTLQDTRNRIKGYMMTYYDITEHKNELKRMEQMAAYDELTKIYNRRYFFKMAIAAFDEANLNNEKVSVIMFDLDNFKDVNDVFGHQAGDYVLETMVKIFKPKLLSTDIIARYGGEEFIIFRKGIHAEASFRLANELCRLLASTPFIYEKRRIKTSASFGVTGSESAIDKSLEMYIKLADNALYVSKSRGKNQVTLG